MKVNGIYSLTILALFFFGMSVQAQHRGPRPMPQSGNHMQQGRFIDGLSDEQKEKLKEIRLAHLEKSTKTRNQIAELEAKQNTLMAEKNPNMREIERVIDDISKLRAQQMKDAAQMQIAVRSNLTDEQRIKFDAARNFAQKRPMMARRMMQHRKAVGR